MKKIFLVITLLGIASSVSACHDIDYYDYSVPTPPVTVEPSNSQAYYGHPVRSRSNAYYGNSASNAGYGNQNLPPVTVSPGRAGYDPNRAGYGVQEFPPDDSGSSSSAHYGN